jgi:hypothetical protein
MADNVNVSGSTVPVAVPPVNTVGVPALHRYREAFDRALPASQALDANALTIINIDVPSAIAMTVGKLPGIMALREQAKALPGFDITSFDQLETYTLAIGQAHTTYMGASAAPEAIVELNEKGMQLRNTLYADAVALATRGLISGDRIGEFKANIGYKNLAFDLMALAGVLRGSWDKISGKTAITTDDLDQAELIGDQLVSAVGTREETPANVAAVSMQRQRNFTVFLNAYDQVRRAVGFLRWDEEDSERIAPSLYSGRGNSNARKKGDDPQPTPGQPVAGAPPVTGAAPAPITAAHPPAPSPAAGLPGASPFASLS